MFSVPGLQYDPKYYDEPNKFNPDRFKSDQSANKNSLKMPYLVFGDGPRQCLGMQYSYFIESFQNKPTVIV